MVARRRLWSPARLALDGPAFSPTREATKSAQRIRQVPTTQAQPRYGFPLYDAPCCGASAASRAFVVTQQSPCSASCRCCGTALIEGIVIPGDNIDADEVCRRVKTFAPWLSAGEAFVEPWACRSRLEFRVLRDGEFASVSPFFTDDAPARGMASEGAAQ
jgi:hypothetical protein